MSFIAKVKRNAKIYHHWEPVGVGLYAAVCNPGLTRGKSELFEVKNKEQLCKVCQIHI